MTTWALSLVENQTMPFSQQATPLQRRRALVVACVLLLHGLGIWALQSGLLLRMVAVAEKIVLPVSVLPEAPTPPQPETVKAALPEKSQPLAPKSPVLPTPPAPAAPALAAAPAPLPLAAEAPPAPNAPTGVATPAAVAPVGTPLPAAVVASPKVELPSSTADYLHNPKPKYPRLSQSRNEQGTVVLTVLVGVDGRVKEVSVKSSSGFELLDRTAREAVQAWTFVPGKRNGVPVEMVVDVPIPFRLTD